MKLPAIHRVSKLFHPVGNTVASEFKDQCVSRSQQLLLNNGYIRQAGPGLFHLLPLFTKSLDKLVDLIDEFMLNVDCQKVIMPTLCMNSLWKMSERFDETNEELFLLQDRQKRQYILCPTHEESITGLLSSVGRVTYKSLPLRMYQVTSKFRDEKRPRFGLIRSREFIMKDLYTFDDSSKAARETYEIMNGVYDDLFKTLKIPVEKVVGNPGNIGGEMSHEYHIVTQAGEDKIFSCDKCHIRVNAELNELCPEMNSRAINCPQIQEMRGIEVAHTFLLGTKYSRNFKASFIGADSKKGFLEMGCYGIGVTRLLSAIVECLALQSHIIWPSKLAPYKVTIITPKEGSNEEKGIEVGEELYQYLDTIPSLNGEVLYDDRHYMTIGKRARHAKSMGIPYTIIVNKKSLKENPVFELKDIKNKVTMFLAKDELLSYFNNEASSD